jgi:hypothetical protein
VVSCVRTEKTLDNIEKSSLSLLSEAVEEEFPRTVDTSDGSVFIVNVEGRGCNGIVEVVQ